MGHWAAWGVKVLAAALSVAVLVGSGLAWASYRSFSSAITVVPFTPKGGSSLRPTAGSEQNILIVGDDSRAGATPAELADIGTDYSEGDNTDTIMVLHLPADGRSASLMSFPRDSIVKLPGGGSGKINSAYSLGGGDAGGGPQALADVLTTITGLRIDHFIKVGMLGFYRISKAVGGVDINLCEAQNASTEADTTHPNGYSGIDLKKGWNYDVQGKQALAFVRQRHGPGLSDYTRIERQRYFIAALFRKLGTPSNLANPLKLQRIISSVSSSLTVDAGLQGTKLLTVASQMQSLTAGKLALATIPMLGESTDSAGNYLGEQIDQDALPAFIAKFVGQPSKYEKAAVVARSTVSVTVFNGGRANGSAATAATALTGLGFRAVASEADASSVTTQIRYPEGMQSHAKTLLAAVPGAIPVLTHTVTSVQLILGPDQAHVQGVAAPANPSSPGTSTDGGHAQSDPQVRTAADSACIQ